MRSKPTEKKRNTPIEKKKRITLTSKEISELFAEGIVTIVLLLLLNVAILVILTSIRENSPVLVEAIYESKNAFTAAFNTDIFRSGRNFILPMFFLLDVIVLYWRLIRRYHQMQLRHIISELHFIAEGNYDHRIPFELRGDLSRIVSNINGLVDSTVAAIEDERRIEQSKDELITNVSHDIRTPLTSIIGYLGLIEDRQYHSEEELLKYMNMQLLEQAEAVFEELGVSLDDVAETEKDMALGNGGLGRLASCFMDSLAPFSPTAPRSISMAILPAWQRKTRTCRKKTWASTKTFWIMRKRFMISRKKAILRKA